MIGRLKGKILEKQAPNLLLDVQGVGYELEVPMSTFYDLPNIGNETTLRTHFIVREDAQLLYGFLTDDERTLFRELIKISGIGGKVALAILSGMQPDEFVACIEAQDVKTITRIPGIGAKTAQRLIIEIKDKLSKLTITSLAPDSVTEGTTQGTTTLTTATNDAIDAMVALGYKQAEAEKLIKKINEPGMSTEELIRKALQTATNK
ncbi:MAG: Holliday junction branch migration protein RuvA [Gammaproteobacteria bacterium]|nr:MAG: Holliday junction branch migration protein RuvA [Gammaproteobacteria bacterium]